MLIIISGDENQCKLNFPLFTTNRHAFSSADNGLINLYFLVVLAESLIPDCLIDFSHEGFCKGKAETSGDTCLLFCPSSQSNLMIW
jgi:hypothetical protein